MPDMILQGWFKSVALAAVNPPIITPHNLTQEARKYIGALHNVTHNTGERFFRYTEVSASKPQYSRGSLLSDNRQRIPFSMVRTMCYAFLQGEK